MLKVTSLAIRGLLLISLPFLGFGFGREFLQILYRANYASPRLIAFIVGAIAFIPVWVLFWRRLREPLEFFVTMEHEFAHLLVGLLFLKAPVSFTANRDGEGEVELDGCNFLIRLAPYFLPTIPLLLLPVLFLVRREYALVLFGALGFSVAYQIFSTVHETHLDQPDIKSTGTIFSLVFLTVVNLLVYGAFFAFAAGEFTGLKHYVWKGLASSYSAAISLFRS